MVGAFDRQLIYENVIQMIEKYVLHYHCPHWSAPQDTRRRLDTRCSLGGGHLRVSEGVRKRREDTLLARLASQSPGTCATDIVRLPPRFYYHKP